jgi:succinylglutamate desuccinylase
MKIILNILTHGDENIGLKVAKELKKLNIDEKVFCVQIANEKAAQLGKRFINQDLNRSFPGKNNGNYEQRLARKLLSVIKSADIVLDIHSTTSNLKDALIVTKLNKETLKYIKIIQPKYALLMNITKENALIAGAKIGLAFEYGKDKDAKVVKKIVQDIKKVLASVNLINFKYSKSKNATKFFSIDSEFKKEKGDKLFHGIKNYQLVRKGEIVAKRGDEFLFAQKDFYPVLFGENNYNDIFGFQGKFIVK